MQTIYQARKHAGDAFSSISPHFRHTHHPSTTISLMSSASASWLSSPKVHSRKWGNTSYSCFDGDGVGDDFCGSVGGGVDDDGDDGGGGVHISHWTKRDNALDKPCYGQTVWIITVKSCISRATAFLFCFYICCLSLLHGGDDNVTEISVLTS